MYQAMLLDRLEKVRKLVSRDEQAVSSQRELLAQLEKQGRVSHDVEHVLELFEELRVLHIEDQKCLEKELAKRRAL
jgi:hypothetical protein